MSVASFGYASLRSDKLDDWAEYGTRLLGLQLVDRSASRSRSAWTTASSASSSIRIGGGGIGFFGWEVADAAALDAVAGGSKRPASRSHAVRARSPTSGT